MTTGINFYGPNKIFHFSTGLCEKPCFGHKNRFQWSNSTLKKRKILHFFSSFLLYQNFCIKLWFLFFYSPKLAILRKNRYFWILKIFSWVSYANFGTKKNWRMRGVFWKKKFLKKLRKKTFYGHFKHRKNSCATLYRGKCQKCRGRCQKYRGIWCSYFNHKF